MLHTENAAGCHLDVFQTRAHICEKKVLDKSGFSGIITLFQAEAARFSPTRIMFCAGHGTLFQDVYAWTGGFTRPFLLADL